MAVIGIGLFLVGIFAPASESAQAGNLILASIAMFVLATWLLFVEGEGYEG